MGKTTFEKFPHPPIKEAVFILNIVKSISIEKIKELSKEPDLIKRYSIFQTSILNNFRIDAKKDSSSTSFQKLQDGLVFKTSEKTPEWVLQIKRNNILLHKVGNYSSWENLIIELKDILIVLDRKFGSDLQIKDVGIRYINHIPIPNTQHLHELFKLLPQPLEGVPFNLNKFLLQLGVEEKGISGLIIESVLELNSALNFIIDLRVTKLISNTSIRYENLESHLDEIRDFKNQLFFNIITEKLKPTFR